PLYPAPQPLYPAPQPLYPALSRCTRPSAAVPAPSAAVPAPSAAVPGPSAAVPAPSAAVPAPSAAVPAQSAPGANNSTDSGWRWRKCREKLATLRAQLTDLINGATPELMTFKMAIQTTLQNRLAQFCASDEPQLMRQRQQQIFSMEPFVSFYQQRKISSIRSVPNGEQFAMYTYCECLLMQAEDQFSEPAKLRPDEEGADHLFCLRIAQSLAMATAMLCSCSKAFQPMLLSFLLAECPLLLPHPPPPDWEAGRELDDRVMRCRSLGRLYAALFCAPPLMGSFSRPKEFSLNHMWSLAAGLVRLSATGRHSHLLTCATLHSVLEVAGASMWRRYGAQFVKLLRSALKLYDQESYFIDSSAVLLVQYLQFVLAAGFITDLGATSSASQLMSSA
uniref:GLE1 RNA export mediator n=1 Tax=Macrostomum lignano TaxID=282301 RepID=A0A1I8HB65_9PLAT